MSCRWKVNKKIKYHVASDFRALIESISLMSEAISNRLSTAISFVIIFSAFKYPGIWGGGESASWGLRERCAYFHHIIFIPQMYVALIRIRSISLTGTGHNLLLFT